MHFNHDDDRQMLADMLRRFLAERYPIDVRNAGAYGARGLDRAIWSELVDLGIVGALFSTDAGGFGGGGFDIMVVFEELGRALSVEPFLGTLMAGTALAHDKHAAGVRVIEHGAVAAFAHGEGDGPFATIATSATPVDGGWVLNGRKAVVAHGEAAELLVVSAMAPSGPSLFVVDPATAGVTVRGYGNIDGGRSADITFETARLDGMALVGTAGGAQPTIDAALDAGLLALSAEALGAMDVARDTTTEYLRTRIQFGQPIGRFQALQHRMVDVLIEIEQSRSAVINAAAAYADTGRARRRPMSAAKYTIGRAGRLVAEESIQLHGGIGMTWELPLSHYAKRLTMIDHQLGDEDVHLVHYHRSMANRLHGHDIATAPAIR